jgi:hypothetical protein
MMDLVLTNLTNFQRCWRHLETMRPYRYVRW